MTFPGRARPSAPRSGKSRSTAGAWSGASTSTATTRPIEPPTAASTAPCSSTRSSPTATGSSSCSETISSTASSARTSPWRGSPTIEVCIGDRYQIGDAVFEVTQPRVTCFRVGIRLDEPRMPSLLVAHHRPGFYFRVIEEGEVQAGDEIRRLQTGPEELTVADVDGLLYLPNRSRRTLERALRIPALSEGWQGSFRELLDQAEHRSDARPATAWEGFVPLTVTAVHRESSTIVSFGLRPAGADAGAWSRRRPIPHASASARRARPRGRLYARIRCRRSGPTTDTGSASSSSRAGGAAGFFRSTSSPATRSTRPHPAGISCCATTTIRSR